MVVDLFSHILSLRLVPWADIQSHIAVPRPIFRHTWKFQKPFFRNIFQFQETINVYSANPGAYFQALIILPRAMIKAPMADPGISMNLYYSTHGKFRSHYSGTYFSSRSIYSGTYGSSKSLHSGKYFQGTIFRHLWQFQEPTFRVLW